MSYVTETLSNLIHQTAFFNLTWGNYLMIAVACVFLFLAIKKGFEPLLLVPIAFGMLLVNIYPDIMANPEDMSNGVGGLLHYFYLLDEWSILPSLIFNLSWIQRKSSSSHFHHRWSRWPYLYFPRWKTWTDYFNGTDCSGGIFLYVSGSDHSAANHETLYD